MRALFTGSLAALLLTGLACATDGPNNPPNESTVLLLLNQFGVFDEDITTGEAHAFVLDIADVLPDVDPVSATLSIDPDDVTVDLGTSGAPVEITIEVAVVPDSSSAFCEDATDNVQLTISVDTNGDVAVTPEDIEISSNAFALANTGTFGMCVTATADAQVTLTVTRIGMTFVLDEAAKTTQAPAAAPAVEAQEATADERRQRASAVQESAAVVSATSPDAARGPGAGRHAGVPLNRTAVRART